MTAPACPECERLHAVHEQSQKIGEFLEWMQSEKEVVFAQYHEHSDDCYTEGPVSNHRVCGVRKDELMPFRFEINKLLAEFFEIDLNKVEEERRALLEFLGRPK